MAYEAASLRRALRHERGTLLSLLAWLDERSREQAETPIRLDPALGLRADPASAKPLSSTPGTVDTLVFDGLLTRRELEVLRLLCEGRTNRAIANDLVISIGTVKFHVNRIFSKLRVANRAEAVARYYALVELSARR
jgi:DNA-binding NarL/FixJ family response regulator